MPFAHTARLGLCQAAITPAPWGSLDGEQPFLRWSLANLSRPRATPPLTGREGQGHARLPGCPHQGQGQMRADLELLFVCPPPPKVVRAPFKRWPA